MSVEMNRRARRAAKAPAEVVTPPATPAEAIEPAVDAAVDRAAVERLDGVVDAPIADETAVTEPEIAGEDGVDVLPTPELVARPGEPLPIVTASPILAAEPGAVEVEQAELAQAGDERPNYNLSDGELARGGDVAVAGQPTLTIERPAITTEQRETFLRTVEALDDGYRDAGGSTGAHHIHVQRHASDAAMDAAFAPREVVIEVVGPPAGRRRAGLTFGAERRRFAPGELTPVQIEALRSDPLLAVGVSPV